MRWKKILLLIVVSLGGCGFIAATLLSARRLEQPQQVDFDWRERNNAQQLLTQIENDFQTVWTEASIAPPARIPPADELLIARRLSLALVGTVPSLEEIRAFEQQPPDRRLDWWLGYLLEDDRFPDYFAERLSRAMVGVENGPFIVYRRLRFVSWLSDQLATNRPYDQIVFELLTSEGLWTDSPAVNFFTVTQDQNGTGQPDPVRLAARTSRAFLGMRIDCLQCHDDQLGEINFYDDASDRGGMQTDFHQLCAFFSEVKIGGTGVRDFGNEEYQYEYLGAEKMVVVPPQVPYAAKLLPENGTRRQQLAAWVTAPENRPFARATVNRIWGLMFGKPLVDPVDSIPQIDVHPALERLSEDFIASEFDLKRLIRIIASTDRFRCDWRADFEVTNQHEKHFVVFPLTRMRPEQVANSVVQSVSLDTINSGSHVVQRLTMFGNRNEFLKHFGDRGENEFEDDSGTIPQRLVMMNGTMVSETTRPNDMVLNAPSQISRLTKDNVRAIETLFLVTFTRRPSEKEQSFFVSRIDGKMKKERDKAIQDIYWTHFNSTEFGWNH